MAWYPQAIKKEIHYHKKPMSAYNRVNLHVAVSESDSLYNLFNRPNQVCSHFYVRKDGTVEQYVDTRYRAAADLEGNDATVSIETAGGVKNADTEKWTEAQVQSLAALWAWIRDEHGISNKIAVSSKIGSESKGLSWHRLGVDGNFPSLPDPRAGRLQRGGGMRYSNSRGKLCPGGGKILQIEDIFNLANKKEEKPEAPKPDLKPTPKPEKPTKPAKPAKTKPNTKPEIKKIAVDGMWGPETTKALQRVLGTHVDGVLSGQVKQSWNSAVPSAAWVSPYAARGSLVIKALQRKLKVTEDGFLGPQTIRALQRKLGTPVDGVISRKYSLMVAKLQRNLNAGKVF